MSAPSCTIEELPAFLPCDFDKELGAMLIKHEGDTQQFLATVFGFLKRKSNFFKGDDPAKRVLAAFKEVSVLA